jgi:hypothetical protein
MAANLTATRKGPTSRYTGPESRRSGRASEIYEIGASSNASAGDTVVFKSAMKRPQQVVGAYQYSISGQDITLTAMFAQTTAQVLAVEVIGLPK